MLPSYTIIDLTDEIARYAGSLLRSLGDDGFLANLNTKARVFNWRGDTSYIGERVTGKRFDNGQTVVASTLG